jgi:hypothetical protein
MMRTGQVQVSVGTGSAPSAEANDARVNLRIEERVSGVVLVDVDFTPAEWWRLITGSIRTQFGSVPGPDQVALIGKQMSNDSMMVPKPVYEGIESPHRKGEYDRDRIEQLLAGETWAKEQWADVPEPKAIATRWSNSGMQAFIRYWAEPVPCDVCGKLPGDHDWHDECRPR